MKERPILMSAPMVRAILAGTKTQTRRAIKGAPTEESAYLLGLHQPSGLWGIHADVERVDGVWRGSCPYGQPGDRLWVRETFSGPHFRTGEPPSLWHSLDELHYWADGNPAAGDWTLPIPSIHMPRWASRITLEITEVRVERLQDISDEDCLAEGIYPTSTGLYPGSPRAAYQKLWEQINGPGSWDANPWVWVVSFKRVEAA